MRPCNNIHLIKICLAHIMEYKLYMDLFTYYAVCVRTSYVLTYDALLEILIGINIDIPYSCMANFYGY